MSEHKFLNTIIKQSGYCDNKALQFLRDAFLTDPSTGQPVSFRRYCDICPIGLKIKDVDECYPDVALETAESLLIKYKLDVL